MLLCTMFADPHGLRHYLRSHFLDTTFKGLYHANAFDLALLIPYFIVLILLAFYGMHRYQLVYLYFKYRKNKTTDPPSHFAELPKVTIQLPIFNEQYVIDRLVDCVCKMEYPADKLEIQVLDDSTDETVEVARAVVERYAAMGHNISYHHRTNREGYKAGALDAGLKVSTGEFVAIFDADFTPYPDWLMKVIHHFADPQVGMVQTRWTHLNRNYSFLTEVEAILLDGHFVLEHGGRSRAGVFFNFNGTAGMWRRQAIDDAGGWEHDTLTEDTDLSYRSQLKGMEVQVPAGRRVSSGVADRDDCFQDAAGALGQRPDSVFQEGLAQGFARPGFAARKDRGLVPPDRQPELSAHDRLEHASDASHGDPFLPGLVPDAVHRSAAVHGVDVLDFQLLPDVAERAISQDVAADVSVSASVDGAGDRPDRHQYKGRVGGHRRQTNRICPDTQIPRGHEAGQEAWPPRNIANGSGWIPYIELLIGCYFALTVWYAIANENYFTVPFLFLFVFGYWYTGLMSLLQGRFDSLVAARADEHSAKPFPVGV